MKGTRIGILMCLAVAFSAVAVYAAVTWHSGPTFGMNSGDLTVAGSLSGLGNKATVQVDATGLATGSCTNPGGHKPKPFSGNIEGSGSTNVRSHNGSYSNFVIDVSMNSVCPSSSWTANFTELEWDTATITVYTSKKGVETNLLGPETYSLSGCTLGSTSCIGTLQQQ